MEVSVIEALLFIIFHLYTIQNIRNNVSSYKNQFKMDRAKSIPFKGGKSSITNVLETASFIPPPPGTRRPTRATNTVATAGVKRRRVIKKHIQQKYLLCGFAIHAFLATPAYLYGNVVDSDKELILRIWPAIVYQATGQICQSIFEHMTTEYRGNSRETNTYRRTFLLATLLICTSLMISGYLFSSAWITVTTTTQTIAIIFYGVFAGIGASLFIWKTHVILEAVRPREDKFVRKTIHLCGEAFCQLFLSFVFTSLHTLYGTAQSILLMAALLVNLIPISLLITRHREGAITKRISVIKAETGRFDAFHPPHHHSIGKFTSSLIDQMDGIELQLQRSWKNPMTVATASSECEPSSAQTVATAAAIIGAADTHCNYVMNADEAYVTFMNPNGVEIMEIIPEEDENISIIRSSTATIDNFSRISIGASQTLKSSSSNGGIYQSTTIVKDKTTISNLGKFQNYSKNFTIYLWENLLRTIADPLRRAITVPKLYSTSFLLSADTFSYVMCLTVLPGVAVTHHALKTAEIPFLFSLLAFPWMCFSLMTPRFGGSLFKRKFQWHALGCTCKGLGLIFISFSTSKLLLSVSSVLLGFGQAVTHFLQDWVLQMSMSRAQWTDIRSPMHFTNGILILVWGTLAHLVVVKYSFQASVGFAGVLYLLGISVWHLVFYGCSSRN